MGQTLELSKEEFAYRLGREFDRKKAAEKAEGRIYGLRTMAKNIVRTLDRTLPVDEHTAVESWRRQIQRFLKANHLAGPEIRRVLALELGCSPEVFGIEDGTADAAAGAESDDEPRSINRDLLARIRSVRRELDDLERLVTKEG